ncbi:MAG: NAD-dependent succinate-semialdehyde dehydrogenase [Actinomycetota bacterium]
MRTDLLIGGTWRAGAERERLAVVDPATGEEIATVASGTPADATAAVDAAAVAQASWSAIAPRDRAEVLVACWEALVAHTDELAELITREHGKPLADARGEVAYSAEFFRWNAEEAVRIEGSFAMAPSGANRILVRHPPVGVVVVVTPWNFPAAMIARKVAPALAAGNAVVIKPAPDTPLTALRVAELLHEAGVPDGVVNVVPTDQAAAWFDAATEHRATRMVSFTGSTETGRALLRRCADRVLKVAMELGGNAPFIVFDDADLDAAVEGAIVAKMRHSAETCTAANRLFVEASVSDTFTEKLAAAMGAIDVGSGFDPAVSCGPMINPAAIASIGSLVDAAVAGGASVAVGGSAIDGPGNFFEPTVLGGVDPLAPITREEIFGPVAPVIPFTDHEAMLAHANDTEMGLAAYVYTGDLAKGMRTAERLEAGLVGINRGAMSDPAAPFGGMKQSGLGREGASEGIYEFCETQYIAADW